MFFINNKAESQVNCDITLVVHDTVESYFPLYDTVCKGEYFILKVADQNNCSYLWKDGNDTISTLDSVIYMVDKPTLITVRVIDTLNSDTCSNQIDVQTYPDIIITFEQLQLTCTNGDKDNGNTAIVKATATGEFGPDEYHYFWNVPPLHISPNDSSVAIGLKAYQKYNIKVIDKHGCIERDTFTTRGYYNPMVMINPDPDTAYIENPHIKFTFDNLSKDSIQIYNYFWDFGDNTETSTLPDPIHTYSDTVSKEYIVNLTVFNEQGCDTVFDTVVFIQPVTLNIPNVFTPNGDGKNEVFEITVGGGTDAGNGDNETGGFKSFEETNPNAKPLNTYFERTHLIVLNRFGNKVYESKNYQNDWDGGNLPDGTYYYILKCFGYHKEYKYKGSVMIFTGSNKK